jgi:hypothetical protein
MHSRLRVIAASVATALLASSVALIAAVPAQATGVPFTPDPVNSTATLTFFDAAGAPVTGGTVTDAPFATYAASSADLRTGGDVKATLYGYTPKNGIAPGAWGGEQLTASTNFPVAAVGSVPTSLPVVTLGSGDLRLADLIADFPNTATDAFQGLYQLRLKTSGGVSGGTSAHYAEADILVTGTTWSIVYPAPLTASSTTLSVAATSRYGTSAKATVTVTGATGTATGTVQVTEGAVVLGSAQLVNGSAVITLAKTLAVKAHSLTASYSGDSAYATSTSAAQRLTVVKAPATVTAKLSRAKIRRTVHGLVTVRVVAVGVAPTGTVTITWGSKRLVAKAVSRGVAVLKLPLLKKGRYKLVAHYSGSPFVLARASAVVTLTVTA